MKVNSFAYLVKNTSSDANINKQFYPVQLEETFVCDLEMFCKWKTKQESKTDFTLKHWMSSRNKKENKDINYRSRVTGELVTLLYKIVGSLMLMPKF